MTRVVRMNESTSDNFDSIPLPARQQLGYFNEVVDKDARSGNGVDALRVEGGDRRDYGVLPVEDGGARVREVTYHLDTTPAPEEPAGGPGSREYNAAHGRSATSEVYIENTTNANVARQSDHGYVSTQREVPGRNQRMAAALDYTDHLSAEAGSGKAANVTTSGTVSDVPGGTTTQVLEWVGDDKERAQKALDKENARENPRSGLKSKLEDIAGK